MSAKQYADIIILAAKIYQESYDKEAAADADAIDQKRQAEELANGAITTHGLVDFAKFYRKNLYQSCTEAAIKSEALEFGFPAYLALTYTWNDILDWAKEVTAQPA